MYMYLDHTFGLKTFTQKKTLHFFAKVCTLRVDRTFAQRIGSVKVKSKSEVTHYLGYIKNSAVAEHSVMFTQ